MIVSLPKLRAISYFENIVNRLKLFLLVLPIRCSVRRIYLSCISIPGSLLKMRGPLYYRLDSELSSTSSALLGKNNAGVSYAVRRRVF